MFTKQDGPGVCHGIVVVPNGPQAGDITIGYHGAANIELPFAAQGPGLQDLGLRFAALALYEARRAHDPAVDLSLAECEAAVTAERAARIAVEPKEIIEK